MCIVRQVEERTGNHIRDAIFIVYATKAKLVITKRINKHSTRSSIPRKLELIFIIQALLASTYYNLHKEDNSLHRQLINKS